MASDYFLQLDGIIGECTEGDHVEWTRLLDWNHSFEQAATSDWREATGPTKGKVDHGDFTFTKYLDTATDQVLKKLWLGGIIPTATFHACRADGDGNPVVYLMIEMTEVIVSNYSINGTEGGEIPKEDIQLSYGKLTYTYTPQDKVTGQAGAPRPVSHDLKNDTVA
jgi:type VI secretion system secreted protein Hcp